MNVLSQTRHLMLSLSLGVFLSGCAPAPVKVEELVPTVVKATAQKTDKSLTVLQVKGGKKTEPSVFVVVPPTVENEEFRNLIVATLQRTGMFQEVRRDPGGTYTLRSEIIFQDMTVPGMTNTLMLMVRYELIETKSGRPLWKESLYTQHELSASDVFAGEHRVIRLLEQGLTKNMAQLIQRFNDVLQTN